MAALPVFLSSLAERDVAEARAWYECQRPGIGVRFLAAVNTALEKIGSRPTHHPFCHGPLRRRLRAGFLTACCSLWKRSASW